MADTGGVPSCHRASNPPLNHHKPFLFATLLMWGCLPFLCYLSLASSLAAAASTLWLAAQPAPSTPHCLC